MKVKNLNPNPKVGEYVDRILVVENYQISTPFFLPLFANGSPTLLFTSSKGNIGNNHGANLTIFGQTIVPETLVLHENFILIAYFFKPFSLLPIFNVPARELTDQPVDLRLLPLRKTAELRERLLNADSAEDMITILDDYISGLIIDSKGGSSLIKYATDKILQDPSSEILTLLQEEMHITERTFQRLFEKNIGIAPNLYRRVCQFNSAFQQLSSRNYHKLSDIAFQNGYADQSHYIRSFKEFTRLVPKEYLNFGAKP